MAGWFAGIKQRFSALVPKKPGDSGYGRDDVSQLARIQADLLYKGGGSGGSGGAGR